MTSNRPLEDWGKLIGETTNEPARATSAEPATDDSNTGQTRKPGRTKNSTRQTGK